MARKISPLETQLDHLADLRRQPPSLEGKAEVASSLASKSNLVVAKSARIAGEWQLSELAPDMAAAFGRFLIKGDTTDKRCEAKIQILKALLQFEYPSPDVFLRGMRHVQMEGSFGPPVDTAAEVRALSAIGLAQTSFSDTLEEIVPLLIDRERDARIGAVRAVAGSGLVGNAALLRLKALSGDEPEVVGECLAGLLQVAPEKSVGFVAAFLDGRDEAIAEAAALALGESRLEEAFPILRVEFERTRSRGLRRTLMTAMALLRRENAIAYLLSQVRDAEGQTSADAVQALSMYDQNAALQERIEAARRHRAE